MLRLLAFVASVSMLGCLMAVSIAQSSPIRGHVLHLPVRTTQNCPAVPGGTGILSDGDFSEAVDPGNIALGENRRAEFAPDWIVSTGNLDFAGTLAWGIATPWCSVDVDGSRRGGIKHSAFATKKSAMYTVTFELSGNQNAGCYRDTQPIKMLLVKAAAAFQSFSWNTSSGRTVQNGIWALQTWTFQARGKSTMLSLTSEDPKGSNCGPVVAAISVNQTSP